MHFICRLWFFIFLARVKDCSQPRVSCSAPQSAGYFPNAAFVLNTPNYTFNHYILEDSSQRMLITHRAAMTDRTWYSREWNRQNIGQTGHQTNSKRISSREHNGENTVTKKEETKPYLLTYLHTVIAPQLSCLNLMYGQCFMATNKRRQVKYKATRALKEHPALSCS